MTAHGPPPHRRTPARTAGSESTLVVALACLIATGLLYALYVALFSVPFAG